jgi:hypothetical protein
MPAAFFCGGEFHYLWPKKLSRATHTKDFVSKKVPKSPDFEEYNRVLKFEFIFSTLDDYMVVYAQFGFRF